MSIGPVARRGRRARMSHGTIATATVTDEAMTRVRTILGALGEELWVEDEKYVDMATALSGTGPTGFRGYTLMVSFPPDAQSNQCVRLEQVITPRWLVLP